MSKKAQFAVRKFQNSAHKARHAFLKRREYIDDIANEYLAEFLESAQVSLLSLCLAWSWGIESKDLIIELDHVHLSFGELLFVWLQETKEGIQRLLVVLFDPQELEEVEEACSMKSLNFVSDRLLTFGK